MLVGAWERWQVPPHAMPQTSDDHHLAVSLPPRFPENNHRLGWNEQVNPKLIMNQFHFPNPTNERTERGQGRGTVRHQAPRQRTADSGQRLAGRRFSGFFLVVSMWVVTLDVQRAESDPSSSVSPITEPLPTFNLIVMIIIQITSPTSKNQKPSP